MYLLLSDKVFLPACRETGQIFSHREQFDLGLCGKDISLTSKTGLLSVHTVHEIRLTTKLLKAQTYKLKRTKSTEDKNGPDSNTRVSHGSAQEPTGSCREADATRWVALRSWRGPLPPSA